jgi:hypothetical protein
LTNGGQTGARFLERDLVKELEWAEDSVRYERRRHAESERGRKLYEKRQAEQERKAIESARWIEDKRRELAEEEARWLRNHKQSDASDE